MVLLSPLVATIVVYFGSSDAAVLAQMAKAPLNQSFKDGLLEYQFNETVTSNFDYMLVHYQMYFDHFLIALAFFIPPAIIMMWAYAKNMRNRYDIFFFVTAGFAPATMLLFASDLSRFMVSVYFSALLAVLYMQTIRPIVARNFSVILICWLVAAIGLFSPLVYANFESASIVDNGILSKNLVVARAIRPLLYASTDMPPPLPPGIVTTDPPGMVWHEQESAQANVWTRRPGTNIFDALGTKGREGISKRTGNLSIVRFGDRVEIIRKEASDGKELRMEGTIIGSRVYGTYPGGRWFAIID